MEKNPFNGENRTKVKDISKIFYTNYYDESRLRCLYKEEKKQ